MTKQIQQLTDHNVRSRIQDYVIKAFPVDVTNWRYKWHYNNGADTVEITLAINGKINAHQAPVLDVIE